MNKYIKYIKIFLVLTSISGVLALINPMTFKEFGSISWALLIIVMFIRPISNIFPKCKLFSFVGKFRRELGILVGMFGIAHVVGYIKLMQYPTFYGIFTDSYVWNVSGMLFWGMMGFLVSIPLLITSNSFATRLFGKHWKLLQRLAYFMFVFVGLHIYLIKKEIAPLIIIGIWISLWIVALIKNKKAKKNASTGPKWLCVPCGYIYDENIGDPDSGIAPGTKFEDIPEDWRCPVCGVGKSDFILLEGEIKTNESKIVSLVYLTDDVIELKVDLQKDVSFVSGQFLTFALKDKTGDFNRSYSVANKEGNIFTFLIKLKPDGRAGILFRTKKVGDKLGYTNISGNFKLLQNNNPKVFIATGTGLSPIYNMLLNTPEEISKKIYFGVANLKDMFYVENLKKFKNLEINLFLSREEVDGYNFGRMDFSKYEFEKNTEFYICGNPGVVDGAKKSLNEKGFINVFSEEF